MFILAQLCGTSRARNTAMAKTVTGKAQKKGDVSSTSTKVGKSAASVSAPSVKGVTKAKAPRRRKRDLVPTVKQATASNDLTRTESADTAPVADDSSKDAPTVDPMDVATPTADDTTPATKTTEDAGDETQMIYDGSMDLCADGVLLWEQYTHALSLESKTTAKWVIAPTPDLRSLGVFVKRYGLMILNTDATYEWSVTTQYPMQGVIRAKDQTRGKTFVCLDQPRVPTSRLLKGGTHEDALQLFAGTRTLRVDNRSLHAMHRYTAPMYTWKIREGGKDAPAVGMPTSLETVETHSRVELEAGVFFGRVGHCETFDGHHVSDSITSGNFAIVTTPLETIVQRIAAGFREQQDTGPGITGIPMSPFLDCAQRTVFQSTAPASEHGSDLGKQATCMVLCEPILYRVTVYAASNEFFCTAYAYAPSPAMAGMFVMLGIKQIASRAITSVMPVMIDVSMERITGCDKGFLFAPELNLGVIANAAESAGLKDAFQFDRTQASYASRAQRPFYNVPDPLEVTWFKNIEL